MEKENKKSQFDILRDFINSTKIGRTISRKQMLNMIFSQTTSGGSQQYGYTVDVYRRYLSIIGVLEIVGTGIYKVNHHINESSSISSIKKAAYSNSYREWFHDFIKI